MYILFSYMTVMMKKIKPMGGNTMDEFETQGFSYDPENTQPNEPQGEGNAEKPEQWSNGTYSGSGVGRKESPFADSPYVTSWNSQNPGGEQPRYGAYVPPVEPSARPKKAGRKGSRKIWKGVLAGVLTVAVAAGSCGITAWAINDHWKAELQRTNDTLTEQIQQLQKQIESNSNAANGNSVSGSPVSADGLTPGQVYAKNVGSVVLINCTVTTTSYGQTYTGTSAGSGFVLTEDGYIVTNAHVVDGASSISVTMHDGAEYTASLVGADETNDVAVLKVEAEGLQAVTLGSSDDLIVGDQVVAIGNPLGELTSTMTVGYVSARDRSVTTDSNTISMIQTDAAINSGNSGGPMFNMKGEVIGITTAKYSGESSSGATIEGIGFAIPIDDVLPLIEDLINYGYINSAYLGVMVSDMDSDAASYYGMPVGAYVKEVTQGYCAEAAGVNAKDIITAVGNIEVGSVSDLTKALRQFKAGEETTITVYRGGAEVVLNITLDEKPQQTTAVEDGSDSGEMPDSGSFEEWYNYFSPYFNSPRG